VKRNSMNAIKMPAWPNSGKDLSRVLTKRLMVGIALTERRGRMTRNTLSDLSWILNLKKSTMLYFKNDKFEFSYPESTIKKSIKFHEFLRYEYLLKTNPIAMILSQHSTRKMTVNPSVIMFSFLL
jgi:hypothetical protein